MATVTIITATYNREHCLEKCYESVKNQTCKDFQWLIIDDGSTDNTKELVERFIQQSPDICIDYVYKKNGGKHTALNESHKHIKGQYCFTLDSDDALLPYAIEYIIKGWKKYGQLEGVGQVIFLRGYSENEPICYVKHPKVPLDTLKEPRIGTRGRQRDCCDVFKTELFIKHPFPVFEGERFIGEGSSFFFIEEECKGVYINKVLYIGDYLTDGLTTAGRKMRLSNPNGGRFDSHVYMSKRLPLQTRIKKGMLYTCYSRFAGIGVKQIFVESDYPLLTAVTFIPGMAMHSYWKKKYFS